MNTVPSTSLEGNKAPAVQACIEVEATPPNCIGIHLAATRRRKLGDPLQRTMTAPLSISTATELIEFFIVSNRIEVQLI